MMCLGAWVIENGGGDADTSQRTTVLRARSLRWSGSFISGFGVLYYGCRKLYRCPAFSTSDDSQAVAPVGMYRSAEFLIQMAVTSIIRFAGHEAQFGALHSECTILPVLTTLYLHLRIMRGLYFR